MDLQQIGRHLVDQAQHRFLEPEEIFLLLVRLKEMNIGDLIVKDIPTSANPPQGNQAANSYFSMTSNQPSVRQLGGYMLSLI
jgi:hypothetical protein